MRLGILFAAERCGECVNADFVIGLGVDEDIEAISFVVGEVDGAFGEVGLVDLVARAVCLFGGGAGDHVAHLAAVDGLALSGLHEIILGNQIGLAVNLDFYALVQIGNIVWHWGNLLVCAV